MNEILVVGEVGTRDRTLLPITLWAEVIKVLKPETLVVWTNTPITMVIAYDDFMGEIGRN